MTRRIVLLASFALAVAPATSGSALAATAPQPPPETVAVAIARTAGACPASIAVRIVTHGYEGGVTLDVTAQTTAVTFASDLVSATPQRIVFDALLRPAYESCKGAGRSKDGMFSFDLRGGKLAFVITPGKGANATPPALLDVSTEGRNPRVKMAFTD
jgi:hypothetical protein